MNHCPALPDIITLESFRGNFIKYQNYLYCEVFKKGLYTHKIYYEGKPIALKKSPIFDNREDSFYHLTCKDYKGNTTDRNPDLRRSERLNWIKPSIETRHDNNCSKACFLSYIKEYKNKDRVHLLNPDDRYIVILEDRESYFMLITAFYLDYDNQLKKKLKEYEAYK